MDIQTAVIGGLTFVVCAGILLFISKFGMKEKSYEEALAEQKKHTTALLGINKSTKPKEKKAKKSSKKVKEKQPPSTIESETAEESEDTDSPVISSTSHAQKLHVEFKEPTIIEEPSAEEPVPNILQKQKSGKKNKVRPILIHKSVENPVNTDNIEVPPANNFEQLHPKDEFELLHSHLNTDVKEDIPKANPIKEKLIKSKQNDIEVELKEKPIKIHNNSAESKEIKENKNKHQTASSNEKTNKEKQSNGAEDIQKSKKQLKMEVGPPVSSFEELIQDIPPVVAQSNGYVTNAGKEKKKKKNDTNSLHHLTGSKDADVNLTLLLNAVRKAELSRSEVQILIDLLLNKQHEAPETLDEWSEGKADPVQKLKRQLADKEKALLEEQEALVGAQAKLREIRLEQATERSQLLQRNRSLDEALQLKHLDLQAINGRLISQNQKIQQMQAQLTEEGILLRNLREENAGLQLQRQQLDIHISQSQETEASIQELQSRNNQLVIELHSLTEQIKATKEHHQNIIGQLQHQANHFKGQLDEKENINRQLDDLRRDFEHRLTMANRIENELKHEIAQLTSVCQQNAEEVRRLEHGKGQTLEEARNLQKHNEDLDHKVVQLKLELRDLQTENSELKIMKANGIEQESEAYKAEIVKLQNELSTSKLEVDKQLNALKENQDIVVADYKNSLTKLQTDLDEQKDKNNELRKKNWKVMDALKAAESKTMETTKQLPSPNVDEIISKVRNEEQQTNIKLIQRLFPNLAVTKDVSYDTWVKNAEQYVQNYLNSLEKPVVKENESEVEKLQAQLHHYKEIIVDTEGILKKLQNHIEQEEILWRKEMRNKDIEIETIRKQYSSELTTRVQHLESQLSVEREAKQKLGEQYEQMKTSQSSAITANSAIIEKLSEEVKQLHQQLNVEKSRNVALEHHPAEVNDSIKLDSSSSNGPLIEQEDAK